MTTFSGKPFSVRTFSRWALPVIFALAIPLSGAQAAGDDRPGPPPKIDIASALSVDAKTAQSVMEVLHEQREKHRALQGMEREAMRAKHEALRAETDAKLAKFLSKEQIDKLHQLLPKPPKHDGPGPGHDQSAPR